MGPLANMMEIAKEANRSGNRIIETPGDLGRSERRDTASGFVAYVPVGSIKKGKMLAATGGAGKTQSGVCYGADWKALMTPA
jgi:hypothetical protein